MEKFLKTSLKNIKCVIFDFDETMYYSPNIRINYLDFIKKTIVKLGKKTETEAEQLMEITGFTITNKKAASFSSQLSTFNITKKDWDDYRVKNYYEADPKEATIVPNALYFELSMFFKTFIVSNEVLTNLKEKAEKLNIDLSSFTKIYSPLPEEANSYPKKKEIYEIIKAEHNFSFNELLVIGDRLQVDINPMLELGGNGILIKDTTEVQSVIEALLNLESFDEKEAVI